VKGEWQSALGSRFALTHLLALERAGPSHTPQSIHCQPGVTSRTIEHFEKDVAPEHHDRCHTMRGVDITAQISPAHLLVEAAQGQSPPITTIGIGDGGNEIGMGKISWDVIRRNIPRGALVACRVPTDYLIVCGVSNWGAYGLATGVRLLRKAPRDAGLFDLEREQELLQLMVAQGPLVDGISGKQVVAVDGLTFERYAEALRRMGELTAIVR
jgi:D-glutamate cyclase